MIQLSLSEIMYEVTEGPDAQVSICVNIELGTATSDTTVHLLTPPGGSSTGKTISSAQILTTN